MINLNNFKRTKLLMVFLSGTFFTLAIQNGAMLYSDIVVKVCIRKLPNGRETITRECVENAMDIVHYTFSSVMVASTLYKQAHHEDTNAKP
jgi:hypothetical protein